MSYADPERRRAYWRAYHAARPKEHAAAQRRYAATPKGREAAARSHWKEYKQNLRQRIADGPAKIAALEAELDELLAVPQRADASPSVPASTRPETDDGADALIVAVWRHVTARP